MKRFPKLLDDQLMLLTLKIGCQNIKHAELCPTPILRSSQNVANDAIWDRALCRDLPAKILDVYMDVFARISSTRSVFEWGSAQPMRTWDAAYQGVALRIPNFLALRTLYMDFLNELRGRVSMVELAVHKEATEPYQLRQYLASHLSPTEAENTMKVPSRKHPFGVDLGLGQGLVLYGRKEGIRKSLISRFPFVGAERPLSEH